MSCIVLSAPLFLLFVELPADDELPPVAELPTVYEIPPVVCSNPGSSPILTLKRAA